LLHGYPEGYKITFWEKLFSRKKAYARIEKAIQSDKKLWAECVNISTQPTIWKHHTFAAEKSNDYSIQVAENLWIHKDYHNVLYKAIEDSPLREKKNMSTQICRTICIHKSFLV
jgi:hypothetical protein